MALWAAVVGLGTMSACIVSRRAVAHVFRLASKLAYWNRYGQADRLTVRRTWARQFSLLQDMWQEREVAAISHAR